MTLEHMISTLAEHRQNVGGLPAGSAPDISSTFYKLSRSGSDSGANARDWSHRLSLEAQSRNRSTLKASTNDLDAQHVITLGTARPAPECYPWDSMVIRGTDAIRSSGVGNRSTTRLMSCARGESEYNLDVALNYGSATGSPQVLRFVTEHVDLLHDPPYKDWETCLTCGTTSALDIVFRILCNRGDWILTEMHTYSGMIESATPQGVQVAGVKMDCDGLVPEELDLLLTTWDKSRGPKPFLLYMIPSGQNPTGTTQPIERRRAIYQIAQRHDLIIIEDDPYSLLQLGGRTPTPCHNGQEETSYLNFVQGLPSSYLSLDSAGRVIRLETTSKILAPGLRCGWMTGCSQIVQRFLAFTEFSTVAPSGPSQLMIYKLLDETWNHNGFLLWLKDLSLQYRHRRDLMLDACDRYLPSKICQWNIPTVGMFVWVQVDLSTHPSISTRSKTGEDSRSVSEIEDKIHARAKEFGVLVSKGSWFVTKLSQETNIYFRLTFGAAPEEQLSLAIERFGRAICVEFERR